MMASAKQVSIDEAITRQRTYCIPARTKPASVEIVVEQPIATVATPIITQAEPIRTVAEPIETADLNKFRKYPAEVLRRQKKVIDALNKCPEKFGVSKERMRTVERLIETTDHPEKFKNRVEYKKAVDRMVSRLYGKQKEVKGDEADEGENANVVS